MELAQLNPAQLALLGAVIVGITELLNRLRAQDYWVVATITCSAVVGGFVGLYYGVDFITGLVAGLAASGTLKTLSSFGNKSVPEPSSVINK
jgi:hypothetical protein